MTLKLTVFDETKSLYEKFKECFDKEKKRLYSGNNKFPKFTLASNFVELSMLTGDGRVRT